MHYRLDKIIRHIKLNTSKSVNILTNGSLLHLPEVRAKLMTADVASSSLGTAPAQEFLPYKLPDEMS